MTELTDEVLATLMKHATIRRANFYSSMAMTESGSDEWQRFRDEYERLNNAVSFLESCQAARIDAA